MNQRTLLGRLLSPAGFGLVLIFFLLPFATASCGTATEHVDATFSGLDMAIGGLPSVTSPDTDPETSRELSELVSAEMDLEPLALLAALAVLGGMAVGVIRARRIRFGAAGAAAVLGAALLVGAIARVPGHIDEFLTNVAGDEGLPEGMTTASHIRYGFWLALVGLVALAAGNGFALLRAQRSAALEPATPDPGAAHPAPYDPAPYDPEQSGPEASDPEAFYPELEQPGEPGDPRRLPLDERS